MLIRLTNDSSVVHSVQVVMTVVVVVVVSTTIFGRTRTIDREGKKEGRERVFFLFVSLHDMLMSPPRHNNR